MFIPDYSSLRYRRIMIIPIICLFIFSFQKLCLCQTRVSGDVSGVWTTEGSPYIITEYTRIMRDAELIIEPGVEVLFDGEFEFRISGDLVAIGTEEDSIIFASARPGEIRWMKMTVSPDITFEYCRFSDAGEGAVWTDRSTLRFSHCLFSNNTNLRDRHADGGAIHVYRNDSTIVESCEFVDNRAANGGAIYLSQRYLEISNSLFIGNQAVNEDGSGGAIFVYQGTLSLTNNIFEGNTCTGASSKGGVISTKAYSCRLILNRNEFRENSAVLEGGAIWARNSAIIMIENKFISNTCENGSGGAVYTENLSSLIATRCLFAENNALAGGGATIQSNPNYTNITNNVFYRNRAVESAGALSGSNGIEVFNCTFLENGGDVESITGEIEIAYCSIDEEIEGEGIILDNPNFINPEEHDFRLNDNSPCVDTGHPLGAYNDADGSRADVGLFGGNSVPAFSRRLRFGNVGFQSWKELTWAIINLTEEEFSIVEVVSENPDIAEINMEGEVVVSPGDICHIPIIFHSEELGEQEVNIEITFDGLEHTESTTIIVNGTGAAGYTGEISGHWIAEDTPHIIYDNVEVPNEETLIIDPGVQVKFDGYFSFRVRGRLIAIGTEDDSIYFTSNLEEPEPGDWDWLTIGGDAENPSRVDYSVIEYHTSAGIGSGGSLAHSMIRFTDQTGMTIGDAPTRIDSCLFDGEGSNPEESVGLHAISTGTVAHSVFINWNNASYVDQFPTLRRNVFAFNEVVIVSGWDFPARAHGNIFFQTGIITYVVGMGGFDLRYNCIFETEIERGMIGPFDQESRNGVPCDNNFNMIQNPLFVDPENYDFNLRENSPCINAGDLDWQRDPDGSWADIGAFHFNHDGNPELFVQPDLIEAEGASEHVVNLTNEGDGILWWRTFLDSDWAFCEPQIGNLTPGADLDLIITIEDPDFDPGIYEADLIIDSNFPENPMFTIPISMRIGGENIRAIDVFMVNGWNMISVNVDPLNCYNENEDRGPDIERMFTPIVDNVILVKDDHGRFYAPEFDFNNIPYWNLTEGYLVKTDSDLQTMWSGNIIPTDTDIPLAEGWNIAAYYPTYPLDATVPDYYALSPIIDQVIIAKDGEGHFMSPEFNFSNMPPWRESQGYYIKVDADVVLNYPPEREGDVVARNAVTRQPQRSLHFVSNSVTGENMSVLITSIHCLEMPTGSEVAAFNSDNQIVGTGTINVQGQCGLAVWGDDESTAEVDGLKEGEAFTLKLWSSSLGAEFYLEPENLLTGYTGLSGSGFVYETDGFTFFAAKALPSIPDQYYLSQNYPNPFNSTTLLPYGLPETSRLSICVYDIAGRLVKTLVDNEVEAGYHTAIWDASTVSAGVYLVKMETEAFSSVRKVILVK